jgi:adenine phosphoribosyltransferase
VSNGSARERRADKTLIAPAHAVANRLSFWPAKRSKQPTTQQLMSALRQFIREIPDFPQPGILFRDISPLLRDHLDATVDALSELMAPREWREIDAVAGIEARGFILASALALRVRKGFVPIRKKGKLPPPTVQISYALEYGTAALEMAHGHGRLLIVDDVLATGGTMRAAAELATRAGYEVAGLISLVDLNLAPGLAWQNLQVRAAIRYD